MNNKNYLSLNKISKVHNGKSIFFCKTDYIRKDFELIKKLNNDVVFVTGNSDYSINDALVNDAPKNIKKWFCQNRNSDNDLLESIPIGLENYIPCSRENHGYVWPHALGKPKVLDDYKNKKITNFSNLIYANFSAHTNRLHRNQIKKHISNLNFITWEEGLAYPRFVLNLLDHQSTLCPDGNGFDTHRLYESLHLNRVGITFNSNQFKYLHHKFPVLLIEDINELSDEKEMTKRIKEINNTKYDLNCLDVNYWINKIKNYE